MVRKGENETTIEGWETVLESMSADDRGDFLAWWQSLPSPVVQQAAQGFNWQALIAKSWRAARAEKTESTPCAVCGEDVPLKSDDGSPVCCDEKCAVKNALGSEKASSDPTPFKDYVEAQTRICIATDALHPTLQYLPKPIKMLVAQAVSKLAVALDLTTTKVYELDA